MHVECTDNVSIDLTGTVSGFPANTSLLTFALVTDGNGDVVTVVNGQPVHTDDTGSGGVGSLIGLDQPFPLTIGAAVFRDLNGNGRWDPDVDDTLYRGDGTVSACPQFVTLTPK